MKSANDAFVALQNFVARNDDVQSVYSDGSGEIKKAVEELRWRHNTSTPGRPQNNGIAERAVKDCLNGARAVLFQSGLNVRWWSKAIKYNALMHNVQRKGHRGQTAWELRFGTPFPAACIPLGCLVHYLPTNPKDKNTGVHKFEPSARQGVFLGYHMHAGSRWSKDFLVLDLINIRTGKRIHVYRTTRVEIGRAHV